MVKVKANSQRKQPQAPIESSDGSKQRKAKKSNRRYGRRLLVFWLRNSAVAVGILFLAYFAFLAIWQLYQPPIPYYFVSRSDLVSRIAGISKAGEADNFLQLGGENGLEVKSPRPEKLGGPLGNVLAIQWTPLVFVDKDQQLRVYQPSDSSLEALQPLTAEGSAGKHSWELKEVLEAFAKWADVPFNNFVPGRLVFPRKKTLVVFCDFHQIFYPERVGLDFDFAYQLEQKKQEILPANSNVDLVLVTSHSCGQVNLREPSEKDTTQTIFANGLQVLRDDKLKFDLRTMWYGQTADKVITGLVHRVHDRGTQLTFPQTPVCITRDTCRLDHVYWGGVKAIGKPWSVKPAETAEDLDKCWKQLQQHEAYWLMEDPEKLSEMARELLVLEQLWLAGFYPSNPKSDSIVAQVLKELEQGLTVKSKEHTADFSYYSTTLNQLRKSGGYWDFWDKLDVPESSENLTEYLTKKLEEQPKRGKLTTIREWDELLTLKDELNDQDELLLSEEQAKTPENFQELLYVRRIAHEMPNISAEAPKDMQPAILPSIRCRNAINLWAAALTPTEPLVNSVNDEIKKLQDWDADRRLLEDLLFAGAINLPEFVNRSSFRTNALQNLSSNEPTSLLENFKTLLDVVESDLKSQITKIKDELQSRRDTIRQQFDQHRQWYLITRHWGREDKIPEGPEFDERLTIAKDGNSVRQLTAYLMAYQTEADKRREYRKSIEDEQTIDPIGTPPIKPNSTELPRRNPHKLSKVILFDKNRINKQDMAELTSQESTDNGWSKTLRNRAYLDFWWTPKINDEPYFKWASKPALGPLDQSALDNLKPLTLENKTAQKLDVTATWPPSFSPNLPNNPVADDGIKEDDWGTGVFRYGAKNEAEPIKLNKYEDTIEASEEDERKSIEVYFRGYTKRDTIRGPQPASVGPIVHSKEVKVKVDSGPKPLIAEKSEEVIVKLIEPRKVNVRFMLDGSGSMERDWEFVAPSTGENNEKEVIRKKPKERLIDELNKFVDAYEKDDLLKIQFLLFSKGDFGSTKWKNWQSPKQEKEFGTSKATFTASFWQFPEKLSAVPSDYKLLKEGIKTIKFGGDTPLEYGLNLAANLLEASTKEQESLLIVISDGCEQPEPVPFEYSILSDGSWSKTFLEDGKQTPVRDIRIVDLPLYRKFMNNWSESNSAVLFALNNPDTIDRRKNQIYYYNFLDETTIDFKSEQLTGAKDRESLKKVFFPDLTKTVVYELDEMYRRIRAMKQRFPERNRIKTLGDIEEIVRPRHEVSLSRDASRKQDRYLARGTKEQQFDGKPVGARGTELRLSVTEGRNQTPTPEVKLPLRGGERYHLEYSEVKQTTTPVAPNPAVIWSLSVTDTENISTRFPLVNDGGIVGRPDFVFVEYQQNKEVIHRAILQDNQWTADSDSNNVKLTLRPADQAKYGKITETAIVHVVCQELERPLNGLWRQQVVSETKKPEYSDLIKNWEINTKVDDRSATISFDRPESSEIGVDSDSKLPSDLIVQAIDPQTGRLPSLQRIQRVTREFSYRDDQLTKVEVTFTFADPIPESFVWGLTDLDTVRKVTGKDGESIGDWNKRVQK
jgi:hypothetical protein